MKTDIYGDGISFLDSNPTTIDVRHANLNEENRIEWVTQLAAVSRGKDKSNNPALRYKGLLKEAAPNHEADMNDKGKVPKVASRPMEFLPINIAIVSFRTGYVDFFKDEDSEAYWSFPLDDFLNDVMPFSYWYEYEIGLASLHTNMRALYNAGMPYELIPYNEPEELEEFEAFRAAIPMFVWAQVPNTHTQISKEAQSDRVAENNNYWLPGDLKHRVDEMHKNGDMYSKSTSSISLMSAIILSEDRDDIVDILLNKASQNDVQLLLKELGYPREIYSRAMYYFKYKEVVVTGWGSNPKVWNHLLLERNAKPEFIENWTQKETEKFVVEIREHMESGRDD